MDLPHRRRRRAIASTRPAGSFPEFASRFAGEGIEPKILRAVYDVVQRELARVEGFPVLPTDDLRQVFAANDDILDALLEELVADFRKEFGLTDLRWSSGQVRTVADLVRFLSSCPGPA